MYIEPELWDWIERRVRKANMGVIQKTIDDVLDNCGIWYSLEELRSETEDPSMTLELACREYWYVIDGNKMIFVNADLFAEDLDEYLGL